MTAAPAKAALRRKMRARRAELDAGWVAEASASIAREVLALPELIDAHTVAAYLALPGEANLDGLIVQLQAAGKAVLVSAYDRDAKRYRLCHLHHLQSAFPAKVGRGLRPSRAGSRERGSAGTPRPTCDPLSDGLVEGRFGVREPAQVDWTDDTFTPDLWLVPGVAFDRQGHRLGHGAGYYDHMLEGSSGIRAGIAFASQVLDGFGTEAHDVDMHLVITEQGTHRT